MGLSSMQSSVSHPVKGIDWPVSLERSSPLHSLSVKIIQYSKTHGETDFVLSGIKCSALSSALLHAFL